MNPENGKKLGISGKIADMLILNRDPLEMKPEDLRSLKVDKLFLKSIKFCPFIDS